MPEHKVKFGVFKKRAGKPPLKQQIFRRGKPYEKDDRKFDYIYEPCADEECYAGTRLEC